MLVSDRGEGWGCKGRRGEVREGRNPGESLERIRGRGKSDVRSSSTPLHKDNKMITSELSPFTHPTAPSGVDRRRLEFTSITKSYNTLLRRYATIQQVKWKDII